KRSARPLVNRPTDEALESFDGRRWRRGESRHLLGVQERNQRGRVRRLHLAKPYARAGQHGESLLPEALGAIGPRFRTAQPVIHIGETSLFHHYRPPLSPNSSCTFGSTSFFSPPRNTTASFFDTPQVPSSALRPHTMFSLLARPQTMLSMSLRPQTM